MLQLEFLVPYIDAVIFLASVASIDYLRTFHVSLWRVPFMSCLLMESFFYLLADVCSISIDSIEKRIKELSYVHCECHRSSLFVLQ